MDRCVAYVRGEIEAIDLGNHPFPLEKYAILERLLREELHVPEHRFHAADEVSDEDLARVHTPRYLEDLAAARETWATQSSELPVTSELISGFRGLVGASMAAARLALRDGVGYCIGGGFHHAFPDHAEGFCYYHDVAIAVEKVRADEGVGRVLIVDTDVHQGNGSALIYSQDPDTYTYSIHQEHNYPLKQRSDLDSGLEDGVEDEEYLLRLEKDLDKVAGAFSGPELVCYVAGVDPYRQDRLGGLMLTRDGVRRRDAFVMDRFVSQGIPVAVFLAGGYAPEPETTARLHLGTAWAAEEACTA